MRFYYLIIFMLGYAPSIAQDVGYDHKERVYACYFEDVHNMSTRKYSIVAKGLLTSELVMPAFFDDLENREYIIGGLKGYRSRVLSKEQHDELFGILNMWSGPQTVKLGDYLKQDLTRVNLVIQLDSLLNYDNRLERKIESEKVRIRTIKKDMGIANFKLVSKVLFPFQLREIFSVSHIATSDNGECALFFIHRYSKKNNGQATIAFLTRGDNKELELDQVFVLGSWH